MQNRSSAVMQQRSEPNDSLDDFPTPPWATRALCEFLIEVGWPLDRLVCREPTANRGHMVKPLREYFLAVDASDVHNYGAGFRVEDFLFPTPLERVPFTVFNPPFRLAEQFIKRALETSVFGVAAIVRSAFLEGKGRHKNLFGPHPPAYVLQFTERVVMHKGKLSANGSTATAYCWIVWLTQFDMGLTEFRWIGECRKRLEREGDYQ